MGVTMTGSTRALDARWFGLLSILVLVVVAVITRAAAFGNPVYSGDDQVYLVIGQSMLHGDLPYVDVWDRKPLGLFIIYAGISLLGGLGVVQSQIVAGGFAVATAFVIMRISTRFSGPSGALMAGVAYLLALPMFAGASANAPIFYDLPVALAALLIVRTFEDDRRSMWGNAAAATALAGIALTIKQTVFVEASFFGLALLWLARSRGATLPNLAMLAFAMLFAGLLPTGLIALGYYINGHFEAYWYSNFLSVFRKGPDAGLSQIAGSFYLSFFMSPLAAFAWMGFRDRSKAGPANREMDTFLIGWLVAAFIGVVIIPRFYDHYGIPLLLPLCTSASTLFDRKPRGLPFALSFAIFVIGQGSILRFAETARAKKGVDVASSFIDAELRAHGGCLYVADGPSILYLTTHACRLTKFVFPDHLAIPSEATGIGTDSVAEIRQILDHRPSVIVVRGRPVMARNLATWAVLKARLHMDYCLSRSYYFPVDYRNQRINIWTRRTRPSCYVPTDPPPPPRD
ncbi:MAG: hypothetical protein H7251_12980 [Acetobacteraceae bacterium]|nr:hypothetical protein [Acetobacteraceae bacterium]